MSLDRPNIGFLIEQVRKPDPHLHNALLRLQSSVQNLDNQPVAVGGVSTTTGATVGNISNLVIDTNVSDSANITLTGHGTAPTGLLQGHCG